MYIYTYISMLIHLLSNIFFTDNPFRMILNDSADWSEGEINVRPDMIKHFWTPDIIIHDLIR